MNWNKHYTKEGKHAFLGASKYAWLRYDKEHLMRAYTSYRAAERGTVLHAFAATCIRLGQKLPRSGKALNQYVNDCIGYHMTPEVTLVYSDNAFGTTDCISFHDNFLRIHDYKSGTIKASMDQLKVYAALFCLEYHCEPELIDGIELRIYQGAEPDILVPDPNEISEIMNKLVEFDKIISSMDEEE